MSRRLKIPLLPTKQSALVFTTVALAFSLKALGETRELVIPQSAIGARGEIDKVITVVAPADAPWLSGSVGTFTAGQYRLVAPNPAPHTTTGISLVAKFDRKRAGEEFSVQLCKGGYCDKEITGSRSVELPIEGVMLSFQLLGSGSPCHTAGGECELFVPSWALSQILSENAIRPLDQIITLAKSGHEVKIVRPLFGDVITKFDLADGSDLSLGEMISGDLVGGTLIITFTRGSLILDFPRDMVLIARAGSLLLERGGIGAISNNVFENILTFRSDAATLAIGDKAILTTKGVISFDWSPLSHGPCTPTWHTLSLNRDLVEGAYEVKENNQGVGFLALGSTTGQDGSQEKPGLYRIDLQGQAQLETAIPSGLDLARVKIISGRPYVFHKDGMKLINAEGYSSTSVEREIRGGSIAFHTGNLVIEEIEDGKCRFFHMRARPSSPQSFNETGVDFDCALKPVFLSSTSVPDVVTATWIQGDKIHLKIIRAESR